MSLVNAFHTIVGLQGRPMTLESADATIEISIKAAVSNYFRNTSAPEDLIIEGQEFVIAKRDLTGFGTPVRGDRLIDPELGENTITEVRPMMGIGGSILGYRIRTS